MKIRLRSLFAAMEGRKEQEGNIHHGQIAVDKKGRLMFTQEMRREYTILVPNMAPIHFRILESVLRSHGYNVAVLLNNCGPSVTENGLKYVHNDTCYPALLVIGQMIDALKSGKYDLRPHRPASVPRPAAAAGLPTTSTFCGKPSTGPVSTRCR